MKTIAKIIAYVLIALVLVAAVGLIYKFTNGFNEDFKTFYVEYAGKQILTADSKLDLKKAQTHTFTVKYTFDSEKSEPKDYKVKITPNITRDFDYTVNGEKYLFSKTGELTSAFGLEKEQSQFSLTLAADFDLQKALQSINGGKTVVIPADAETNNPYPYRLSVSSYNEKVVYHIDLKIVEADVTDITLNPSEIIFGGGSNTKPSEKYSIEYLLSGDATNLSDLSIDGVTQAKAGEKVTFKVTISDGNYSITGMRIRVMNSADNVTITENNGVYSFTMPQGNVYVWVDFEYNAPPDKVMYGIGYDSLGWAGLSVVNLNCPAKAAAGESVTFTATVKPEYASEYKISGINVEFSSGEAYIEDLQGNNGTYNFTMPDTELLEADGYITLMFYIIPIDM